jgi:ATP-dependent RNA helicase DeaD
VQEAVLDPALSARDLLVSAQTGSGKTLGFGLAIAPVVLGEPERFAAAAAPLALVIAPTRELALQVKRELAWLFAKAGAVMASCVGGMDMRDERRALERGAHIVVATPGRLRDHIMRGSIDLSALRSVVLDEADEMLDLGFREDLEFILGEAPTERQTLLFSATVSPPIAQLAKSYQRNAERVVTKSETTQHADIEYRAMTVGERDTENAVINTLLFHAAPNSIVFANTRAMVNRLTTRLSNRGFKVVALSGELSQAERTHALQAMRDGRADVCVATDVAARGIDLPNLDLVVHAELPNNHETLLHRSGRTGRAGRKGVSALVVTHKSRRKAQRILSMAKLNAEWVDAPSADAVNAREEARLFADPMWQVPPEGSELEAVEKLTAAFSDAQLAAAFLRFYRSVRSAPEDLAEVGAKPPEKADFGESRWFSFSYGRADGAEPRRLLPMLCKAAGLDRHDVGAIRVQDDRSLVQIRAAAVTRMLETLGDTKTLEPGVLLTGEVSAPEPSSAPSGPRSAPKPYRKPSDGDAPRPKNDWKAKPAQAAKPEWTSKPAAAARPGPGPDELLEDRAPAQPRPAARPVSAAKPGPSPKPRPGPKPPYEKRAGSDRKPGAPWKSDGGSKPAREGAYGKPAREGAYGKPARDGARDKPYAKPYDKARAKPYGKPNDEAGAAPGKPRPGGNASNPGEKLRKPGEAAPRKPGDSAWKPRAKPGAGPAKGAKPFGKSRSNDARREKPAYAGKKPGGGGAPYRPANGGGKLPRRDG